MPTVPQSLATLGSVLAFSLALALGGCSGSSGGQSAAGPTENNGGAEIEPGPETDEQKIRRAQLASCGPMCERLVDCSVADARKNLSEKELAELRPEELKASATEECSADCGAKSLSPRQIGIVQECVNGPQECEEFITCLEQASRK